MASGDLKITYQNIKLPKNNLLLRNGMLRTRDGSDAAEYISERLNTEKDRDYEVVLVRREVMQRTLDELNYYRALVLSSAA